MIKNEKAALSIAKIFICSVVFILCFSIITFAANVTIKSIIVRFPNNVELNVLTTKSNVEEILEENNITLAEDETTMPGLSEEVLEDNLIKIIKKYNMVESSLSISLAEIESNYDVLTEEEITVEEEIPYETNSIDLGYNTGITKVVQHGFNGLRRVTYKIMYKNGEEVSKEELDVQILKEPVREVIRTNIKATADALAGSIEEMAEILKNKVEGLTPTKVVLNTSAYTAATCDKQETDVGYGRTGSGVYATEWHTVASGSCYPIGTIIYIPYFADKPNGGWFIVQDRGGAIKNDKLDIYMLTYSECKQFGRKNLECYVYVLK